MCFGNEKYNFEQVPTFTYLGDKVNKEKVIAEVVQNRLPIGKMCYFSL
jgi:hypothetical protein